jgi:hypothetical protein
MARIGVTGIPAPYHFFGTFAGLPFWGGGLTLLSAAPGIGKTSWMLHMLLNAAALGVPSADDQQAGSGIYCIGSPTLTKSGRG